MSRHFTRRERRLARRMARVMSKSRTLEIERAREQKEFVRLNWRRFAGDNADLEVE